MWNAGDTVCRFSCDGSRVRRPFVETVYAHELNPTLREGSIEYTGYFYIQDSDLPLCYTMRLYKTEKEPVEIDISGNTTTTTYRTLFDYIFRVEIFRREQYEDTSQFADDPEEGCVCFFPTHREKIWFRILEDLSDGDGFYTLTCIE